MLSLRTVKSTIRGKLFSRETAVSCSMCTKLCPLACKANTQHSQQHVCVCVHAAVFPYICVFVEGFRVSCIVSSVKPVGKEWGGATQSSCREVRQQNCITVGLGWGWQDNWKKWEMLTERISHGKVLFTLVTFYVVDGGRGNWFDWFT